MFTCLFPWYLFTWHLPHQHLLPCGSCWHGNPHTNKMVNGGLLTWNNAQQSNCLMWEPSRLWPFTLHWLDLFINKVISFSPNYECPRWLYFNFIIYRWYSWYMFFECSAFWLFSIIISYFTFYSYLCLIGLVCPH